MLSVLSYGGLGSWLSTLDHKIRIHKKTNIFFSSTLVARKSMEYFPIYFVNCHAQITFGKTGIYFIFIVTIFTEPHGVFSLVSAIVLFGTFFGQTIGAFIATVACMSPDMFEFDVHVGIVVHFAIQSTKILFVDHTLAVAFGVIILFPFRHVAFDRFLQKIRIRMDAQIGDARTASIANGLAPWHLEFRRGCWWPGLRRGVKYFCCENWITFRRQLRTINNCESIKSTYSGWSSPHQVP